MQLNVQIPTKIKPIFEGPARYRGAYGGRGSGKTMNFARMAVIRGLMRPTRIVCCRELQKSIRESSHAEICEAINDMELDAFYEYGRDFVRGKNGTEFIYQGLSHDPQSIKSLANCDILWGDEAEYFSEVSWRHLVPTIRKKGSEIWMTWNPERTDSPTKRRLIDDPPSNAKIVKVNWSDNPWFNEEMETERLRDMRRDPDMYLHIWEGECLTRSDAQIFNGKWAIAPFVPEKTWDGPYYGADWGFSQDPTVLLKMWIHDKKLWIEYEEFGYGVELDDIPVMFDKVPDSRRHKIYADCARPETIAHIKKHGFNIEGAEKWPESVADGIEFIRGAFDQIVIHTRCPKTAEEARLYSYKIDRLTGDIMADVVDKHNHSWDSVRYGLAKLIKHRPRKFFDL
jgi:phage terminase large subunit